MLDFMGIQKSIWMEAQKELIGKDVRKWSLWLMILQFQALILTTQTISDFGDQSRPRNNFNFDKFNSSDYHGAI